MTTALRPMSTSELLDRTFSIYRNNFALFAGIAIVPGFSAIAAPLVMLAMGLPTFMAVNPVAPDPRILLESALIYLLLFFLFYAIGFSLATGATIYAVSKVHLDESVNISESYQKVIPLFWRILGIIGLVVLRIAGLIILVYAAAGLVMFAVFRSFRGLVGGTGASTAAAIGLMVLAFIPLVFVGYFFALRLYLKYSAAVPACMLENTGASASLKRSSFLTKGSLWRIFGIYFLTGLIGGALSFSLNIPVTFIATSAPQVAMVWQFVATFVAYTLSFPISTIAISLVYYDQRVRKEAFDLQLMMDALSQPGAGQAAAATPIG